jgi:hypothetical protein
MGGVRHRFVQKPEGNRTVPHRAFLRIATSIPTKLACSRSGIGFYRVIYSKFLRPALQCDGHSRRGLLKVRWRRVAFLVCAGVMALCLVAGGILLYARDGVTPDPLPRLFTISDSIWLLLGISFVFYFKKPLITVVAGWLTFLAFVLLIKRFSDQDPLFWLWYEYLFLPLFIVASHLGLFLNRGSTITDVAP